MQCVEKSTETFTGGTGQVNYDLIWPMDITNGKTKVKVDNIEILDTEFTITNKTDTTKSYERTKGRVTFESAIATGLPVQIDYSIDPQANYKHLIEFNCSIHQLTECQANNLHNWLMV